MTGSEVYEAVARDMILQTLASALRQDESDGHLIDKLEYHTGIALAFDWALQIHRHITTPLIGDNPFLDADVAMKLTKELAESMQNCAQEVMQEDPIGRAAVVEWAESNNTVRTSTALAFESGPEVDKAQVQVLSNAMVARRAAQKAIIERLWQRFVCLHMDQLHFLELFNKCESPLEKAFLIGYAVYAPGGMWELVGTWEAQASVGTYRLDFAIRPNANVKIAIELDGHTYHERTETQAIHDRERDRFLQAEGWDVLRFHRKEITDDLKRCVEQTVLHIRKVA